MKLTVTVPLTLAGSALSAWVTPKFAVQPASGWTVQGVANGLTSPRTIAFDTLGNLLVLESGAGITALTLNTDGSVKSRKQVLTYQYPTHGLAISPDGKFIYASSSKTVWRWNYNAAALTVSNELKMVTGLDNPDHVSRTLLLSKKYPNLLIVSRGAGANVDPTTTNPAAGPATVAAFDLAQVPTTSDVGLDWSKGALIAYGARNEVGIAEDSAGRLWGVENSADDLVRTMNGTTTDVHQDNPAEKLHLFGDTSAASKAAVSTKWYGYPACFSVWNPASFPSTDHFAVGDWFVQVPNATFSESNCNAKAQKPKLLFQAHSAPLDIKFGPSGDTSAYVTFHGSWDRTPPTGYKVVSVPGTISSGAWNPTAPLTSTVGYNDILTAPNVTACASGCFRPVGLAWDPTGKRLYVSGDVTGEVLVLQKI